MKRVLSFILVLSMVLGSFGMAFADSPVSSVTGNEKVDKLIELGLVRGDEGGYRLEDTITRAEVAAMVVRSLDLENVADASINFPSQFTDMNEAGVVWARGYVTVAAGQGIVNGYPNGSFVPNGDITYAEAAKMLVEVLGGLTEAEEKVAVWPTTYLAKAAQLGIFKDVEGIADYDAPAVRETLFEMVFNTVTNKDANLLIASTVEGIVVENYRTERLAKDEIVVHVMQDQVQREGKYYEKDDEFKIRITEKLAEKGLDVETLLGKVVTVSFDKDDSIVDVKVNESYSYLQGKVDEIREKEIKVGGRWYTIGKEEGRTTAVDERLYQVYLNNEDLHYYEARDFDANGDVVSSPRAFVGKAEANEAPEFARLTVRNGKVLFIDAFEFEDIAPAAKDVDGKVLDYYDDTDGGEISQLRKLDSAYVIVYEKDEMRLGDYGTIEANDVAHWYTDDRDNLTVFVRPYADNNVQGEYVDASARKAKDEGEILIKVDSDEYKALINSKNRNPVYSTLASELVFETLTEDYDEQLEGFDKQDVTLLLDMFNYVQLIGSETLDGSFYALVSNTARNAGEIKLLRADGEDIWYGTTRNTIFKNVDHLINTSITKDKQFNEFQKYDLVKVVATEDYEITSIERLTEDGESVYKINKDVIDYTTKDKPVAGSDFFYLSKNVIVFVEKDLKVMDIATFLKDYNNPTDKNYDSVQHPINAYEANVTKGDVARIIVITEATRKDAGVKDLRAEVQRVRFTGGSYYLTLLYGDNKTEKTHKVADDVVYVNNRQLAIDGKLIGAGDIVKVDLTKDDKEDIRSIARVDLESARKVSKFGFDDNRREYFVRFDDKKDPALIWISKDADQFGKIEVGKWVRYTKEDKYDVVDLIAVVSAPKEDEGKKLPDNVETYNGSIELDGNLYIVLGKETYPVDKNVDLSGIEDGDLVEVKYATVRGETVIVSVEKYEEDPGNPPVDPPVDPEEITAEATLVNEILGIKSYAITVEGAELEAVEKVLVNGEEKIFEIKEGVIRFNSGSAVETVKIVVGGEPVDVTVK